MANSGGRSVIGVLSLFAGSYLIYASVTNQAPIKTLLAIIQDPKNAAGIVGDRTYKVSSQAILDAAGTNQGANSASGNIPGASAGGPAIVAFARAQIGKPYASPGDSNTTWDCSGLTKAAVKYGTGIDLPHLVSGQIASTQGKFVTKSQLQPGDVVIPMLGHCGIFTKYDTDGTPIMVDAPDYGRTVTERRMWAFVTAKRFAATPVSTPGGGGRANVT